MTERDQVVMPALLRAARKAYGRAVRSALIDGGCQDLPANGPFVLGAIAGAGTPMAEVIATLGLSKQAAGALVDSLVVRGYLEREVDLADRRRLRIALSERGAHAAALTRDAVAEVDGWLLARVGEADLVTTRRVLWELVGSE